MNSLRITLTGPRGELLAGLGCGVKLPCLGVDVQRPRGAPGDELAELSLDFDYSPALLPK